MTRINFFCPQMTPMAPIKNKDVQLHIAVFPVAHSVESGFIGFILHWRHLRPLRITILFIPLQLVPHVPALPRASFAAKHLGFLRVLLHYYRFQPTHSSFLYGIPPVGFDVGSQISPPPIPASTPLRD
jgi:hypothetical protein